MPERGAGERSEGTASGGVRATLPPLGEAERRRLLGFLRKLPHDVPNAILPLRIAGDLLRRADGDTAIVEQVTRILDDQSAHAQRLIDDLDRTVRVLIGELPARVRACDLERVVADGVSAAKTHAPPSTDVTVIGPARAIELEADPKLLAAAVEELVDNAARFAGHHPIRVEVEREADAIVVRVRDGGPGVPPERLERVFEPFVAADTVDSGWGIGLGFVRLVARAHGGSITGAAGDGGRGLVMTLRLPLKT
jgi:signal transduction histidine kinase